MPTFIRFDAEGFHDVEDTWTLLADDAPPPAPGVASLIVSSERLQSDAHLDGRPLGVTLASGEAVETLAPYLARVSLVALTFPKFRDGRALSAATLLRERWGFQGEVRAVGEVLRDLAFHMVRCGFDAFAPADGSDARIWAQSAGRHRHVYPRAADAREPAFLERTL